MTRTWTLHSTLTIATGGSLPANARALTNDARDTMYFRIADTPNQKVYSWDGATLTDIAGTSFPVTGDNEFIGDMCLFNGSLFVGYGATPFAFGPGTSIYRHTGGTSWTNEYTLDDEASDPIDVGWIAQSDATDGWVWCMDCDASYMAVVGTLSPNNPHNFHRLWTRNTAGSWEINEIQSGVYSSPGYHLVGLSKGSDYGTLAGYDQISSTNFRPILRGSPDPWSYLTGAAIGARIPVGYGGGFSFFSHNTGGTTWELKYSNDWGTTLFTAGGLTRDGAQRASFKLKNLGDGIIMLNTDSNQAYAWDSVTNTFVADGTTGSQTIYDFFILNDQLFALTNSGTANSVEIWTAGLITCGASLYYGIEVPELASNLPFCVEPGGLAISPLTHIAVLGTTGNGGQAVVYGQAPYTTWNDISGIVPTGTAVTSIKFV